jgi:uncharacterized membrane protein
MALLILGLALFIGVHLIPMFAGLRRAAAGTIGEVPYKIGFAVLSVAGIVLIVRGWGSAPADFIYVPVPALRHVTMLLVLFAFILLAASHARTNIKRLVRNPMLSGVLIWAIGHLLANGETRAVILFGSFAVWAVVEILLTNARDGVWVKPAPVPVRKDIITVVIAAIVFVIVMILHPWIAGVAILPVMTGQ